jgi:hypothetical protein
MMIYLINNLNSIITANNQINSSGITRYNLFTPSDYPAICYEAVNLVEDSEAIDQHSDNKLFEINCYYLEETTINNDMSGFIDNVESIIDTLRANKTLNGSVLSFSIKAEYIDRNDSNNLNFVAKIIITGRMR